jgi:hypothetical protein
MNPATGILHVLAQNISKAEHDIRTTQSDENGKFPDCDNNKNKNDT